MPSPVIDNKLTIQKKKKKDRNKLEGTLHKVGVAFGHELDPSYRSIRLCMLGRGDERDQPVPIKEPAGAKGLETQCLHRGRGRLQLGGLSSGRNGSRKRSGHNPEPSGGGKRERRM